MPVKALIIPLEQGKYYHVYNRGNNKEKLFYNAADYYLFMRKYQLYLGPHVQTFAYCLLPNHFHFLIRIKESQNGNNINVANQFRKLFICYAKRINTIQGRKGCLLTRNYRRVEIHDEKYLRNVLRYIHFNPVKHGYCQSISGYIYSSFHDIYYNRNPYIDRAVVMHWFNGWQEFMEFHNLSEMEKDISGMLSDD